MTYTVRSSVADELPLVFDSWIRSLRDDAKARRTSRGHLAAEDFAAIVRPRIEAHVTRHGVLVATLPEVPDEVLSWAVVGEGVMEYAYTKRAWRHRGAMRAILERAGLLPGQLRVGTVTATVMRWVREGKDVRIVPQP